MNNRKSINASLGARCQTPHAANRLRRVAMVIVSLGVAVTALSAPLSSYSQAWGQGPPPRHAPTPAGDKLRALDDVRIDQRLNESLPLDATFRDEEGNEVKLGQFFGQRPVVLALVYYSCPMLCNQVLNGTTSALEVLKAFEAGRDFEVVAVSFDPREDSELARQKKDTYVKWYNRPNGASGFHFLTGDQSSIERLTDAAGFHYKWDERTNQYIHASAIMVATPDGKLARYFYGIDYAPKDLRLGLVEASAGKIGTPVDQLLLYCYHYDPATGKYGAAVMNLIRLGGAVTLVALLAMFIVFRWRSVRREGLAGNELVS